MPGQTFQWATLKGARIEMVLARGMWVSRRGAVDGEARRRTGQRVMVPRMQPVAAPPTQTVPSASVVISMVPARPTRAPWETR